MTLPRETHAEAVGQNTSPEVEPNLTDAERLEANLGLCDYAAQVFYGSNMLLGTLENMIVNTAKYSRTVHGTILDYADAYQVACESFLKNIKSFDPEKSSIGNFMLLRMLASIGNEIQNTSVGRRISVYVAKDEAPTEFLADELVHDYEGYGYESADVEPQLWLLVDETVGYVPKYDYDYNSAEDQFSDAEYRADFEQIRVAIEKLSTKHRSILLKYFSNPETTQQQVANEFGMTHEGVSYVIKVSLERLRKTLAEDDTNLEQDLL